MASLQMAKNVGIQSSSHVQTANNVGINHETKPQMLMPKPTILAQQQQAAGANWGIMKVEAVETPQQFINTLEDDQIEQMIEELLDYGSIELCSIVPSPQ